MIFANKFKTSLTTAMVGAASALGSCSDDSTSSTPTSDSKLKVTSSLTEGSVSAVARPKSGGKIAAGQADSVTVDRVRMMVNGMEIQTWVPFTNDTFSMEGRYEYVRRGPFVVEFTITGEEVTEVSMPGGVYKNLRFNIQALSSAEKEQFTGVRYTDFVSGNTLTMSGVTYSNGVSKPFTFKTARFDRVDLALQDTMRLSGSSVTPVALQFSPRALLKQGGVGAPLDPTDPANKNSIENAIRAALSVTKQ